MANETIVGVVARASLRSTRARSLRAVGLVAFACSLVVLVPAATATSQATWSPVASMSTARFLHTATALADGRVLVAGGSGPSGLLNTGEVYDPGSNSWDSTGQMTRARYQGNAARLTDGRVLAIGGDGSCSVTGTSELYDPQTNSWTASGTMNVARRTPAAALLEDGRVLVVGGVTDCNGGTPVFASAEAYDTGSGTWSPVPSMSTQRSLPIAVTLLDGRVLVAGGFNGSGRLATAEIYDPVANAWSAAASMATPHYNGAGTLLQDGRVLIVGGETASGYAGAEVYDPTTNQWSATGPMTVNRGFQHALALLSDGSALLTGGFTSNFAYTAGAELYDPSSNTWSSAGTMSAARGNHTAIALVGGAALVAGGQGPSGSLAGAELYGVVDTPPPGFVTRTGTKLQLDGQPYRPIGFNVYNANSNGWCWYEMDEAVLGDAFTAMGPGKNAMRAWFFQQLATTNGQRDWSRFDRTLATAQARGVKVVATLVDQWGDCGRTTTPGYGYKDRAWYESAYNVPDASVPLSYRDWVAEVVARYKDNPTVLAWQLVNEPEVKNSESGLCEEVPESTAFAALHAFADDVAGLIKSIDPYHLVSLGTIGSGQCGAQGLHYPALMSLPSLDLCEFHDHTPAALFPGNEENNLQLRIDQCTALDKPLLLGELGVDLTKIGGGTLQDRADIVDAKLCAQLGAGAAGTLIWAWSSLGSNPANTDIGPGDPVLDVLTPWSNPSHTCVPPSSPGGVVAAAGDGSAAVTWLAPGSNGGSVVRSYTVTASPGGQTVTVLGDVTNAALSGLANGTTYTFAVVATNAAGSSPASAPSAAVTPQAGSPPPAAASGTASPTSATTVTTGTDPAQTGGTTSSVTVPAGTDGGQVSVTQSASTEGAPSGYDFGSIHIDVRAPAATPENPLTLVFTITPAAGQTPESTQIYRTEAGVTAPLADCDPSTLVPGPTYQHAVPDPCVWEKTLVTIGGVDYIRATVLTSAASIWNTATPKPASVTVSDGGYSPRTATLAFGGRVNWSFTGKRSHSVTDAAGLGAGTGALFDSGPRAAGSYAFRFVSAGSYAYKSTVKGDTFSGVVAVKAQVTPATGSTASTFTLIWASSRPASYVFDLRYRFRPAGSTAWRSWSSWQTGATGTSGAFVPAHGAGKYAFGVRLRNSSTSRASDWCPDLTISVT